MDYNKIKADARERINGHLWDIWKPILIMSAISIVVTMIVNGIFGSDTFIGNLVEALCNIALFPIEIGYLSYLLKFVRKEEYSLDELKAFFPKYKLLIVVQLILTVFVFLGLICLIIPGIIVSLWYAMVNYILIDNPDLEPSEYLERSKEMMDGYKMDYFVFILTFIGWALLCVFIIPAIWVVPYASVSMVLYYEELKKEKGGVIEAKEKVKEASVEEVKTEEKVEVKKASVKKTTTPKKTTATKKAPAKKTSAKTTTKKTTTNK